MNKYSLLGAALTALFNISSNTVYAAGTGEMDEVVVTATRVKAEASDSPASVTVVSAKDIETKNVSRLGDALDQVPGLYLRGGALGQSQGTIGTSGMSLRGVDQTKTLILMDGQPIQDASSGKMNWRIPFIEDISRVEVVPGSFSSLYGSNAIGGVINIITKQPDKREFTAKIKKGWSDASGEEASIYFRDKMENGLGFAGGIGYQNRDSYVNDFVVVSTSCTLSVPPCGTGTTVAGMQPTTTREGAPAYIVGDMGATPWNSTHAAAKFFYDLNARDKIYAGVNHQETDQKYTQFKTYVRNVSTGVPVSSGTIRINGVDYSLNFNSFSSQPLHEAATRYFAGYDGTVGNNYLLKADIAKIERKYSYTASSTTNWNGGAGTLTDAPNDGLDGTVQLTFPVGARHVWVTGLALHKDSVNQRIYTLSNWRNPDSKTVVNSSYNGYSTTASVFAQDEFGATDALKIYLGGRWDDWKTRGDYTASLYPERSVSAFSPKVSAVYQLKESGILRASFGRSFHAPTNQDLYLTTVSRREGTTESNPNLQPERGTTWEVGGEFRLTGNTKTTVACYDTRLSDLIYLNQINKTLSRRINAGKAKIQGIELSVASKLTNWLELDANYAHVNSRMLENAADLGSVGKRLTDSPKNIAGIGLTARHGPWSGMLNARYVSHVFWTAKNEDVVEGVPRSYDSHTMVNAKLGYEFAKGIKGSVAINNLLDEKAYSYFLLPGRNATAEMDFSF